MRNIILTLLITITGILSAQPALGTNGLVDFAAVDKRWPILDLDVARYFGVDFEGMSELERKVFSNSDDFKGKHAELTKLRTALLSQRFFFVAESLEVSKYDLTSKSFTLSSRSRVVTHNKKNVAFGGILFTDLPSPTTADDFVSPALKLKVEDEMLALEIEKNRGDARLVFCFNLEGTIKVDYLDDQAWIAMMSGRRYVIWTKSDAAASRTCFTLYNEKTGKIYAKK